MSINLHSMAREIANLLLPEVTATLYRSAGQTTGAGGEIKPAYAPAEAVTIQMQSEGATTLYHADLVGMEEVTRKIYLFSKAGQADRVAGIVRPLSRNGDMLHLPDNTWWLITAVLEDFSRSGWVSARATLQVRGLDE